MAIALLLDLVGQAWQAVGLLLAPFKTPFRQYLVVSWAGLRGAASIVFHIMAAVSDSYTKTTCSVYFLRSLFSIILQGSLLPVLAKKCEMIDENADVMKTFTDYTENTQIQFIQLPIGKEHPWVNREIREIRLHPGTLIAVIKRGERVVVPKGNTEILPGDTVILGAEGFSDNREILLKEIRC